MFGVESVPHTFTWCWGDLYYRLSKNRAKRETVDQKSPPKTKRKAKAWTEMIFAHLPRIGVRWNKKTRMKKREISFFFKKREQDMRC